MDQQLAALVARAREAARRRSFFLAFSSSPVDFINAQVLGWMVSSQGVPECCPA